LSGHSACLIRENAAKGNFGVGTDLEGEQAGLREGSELEKRNKRYSINKI
jgi:hypothetical protein